MLNIIVNSSNNIDVGESQKQEIAAVIEHRLGRFSHRLTRIEAYIEDENGPKTGRTAGEHRLGQFSDELTRVDAFVAEHDGSRTGGMDKRCMLGPDRKECILSALPHMPQRSNKPYTLRRTNSKE